jgi:hypothetical protein
MDQAQLDKLSYVSRHVDDLFDQRIQQFNTVYEAQIGWLQEFVSGKEATLKQQLEYPHAIHFSSPKQFHFAFQLDNFIFDIISDH